MYLSKPKNIFLNKKCKIEIKKEKKNQCQLKKMESQKFKTDMFSTVQEEKTEKKKKKASARTGDEEIRTSV